MQKIGSFLAELRKEKNLTQNELGEQIGVTNKTISRWENGNYLPPVEILQILSKLYDVSINEILNGERINDSDYKNVSEENVKCALNRSNAIISKHKKNYELDYCHCCGFIIYCNQFNITKMAIHLDCLGCILRISHSRNHCQSTF